MRELDWWVAVPCKIYSCPVERCMTHSWRDPYISMVYGSILEETTEPTLKMFEGLLFMKCQEWHFVSSSLDIFK